jgi:hypothetical protein
MISASEQYPQNMHQMCNTQVVWDTTTSKKLLDTPFFGSCIGSATSMCTSSMERERSQWILGIHDNQHDEKNFNMINILLGCWHFHMMGPDVRQSVK